jgi:hypothetical protein
MSTKLTRVIDRETEVSEADIERLILAQERVYAAEIALHHARQTHVDSWIAAAYDRLHEALEAFTAA